MTKKTIKKKTTLVTSSSKQEPELQSQEPLSQNNSSSLLIPCFIRKVFWIIAFFLAIVVLYIYIIMIPRVSSVKPIYITPTPNVVAPIPSLLENGNKILKTIPTNSNPIQNIEPEPILKMNVTEDAPVDEVQPQPENLDEILALQKEISHLNQIQKTQLIDTLNLYHLIINGYPFRTVLNKILSENPQNIFALRVQEKLSDFELTGIPTLLQLQKLYAQEAKMTAFSFYVKKEPMTWQENIKAFLKSLVQIRPIHITSQELIGPKILYKAHDELSEGRIQNVLDILQKLPPEQYVLMADFIRNASARLTAQQIITSLIREERN